MSSVAEQIQELEARRARNRAAHEAAHSAQFVKDYARLIEIEEEHGYGRALRIDIGGWKADVGAATLVVLLVPDRSASIFKRYEETVSKAKQGTDSALKAAHVLGEACLLYPSKKNEPETYEATMELAAGILTNAALQVAKVVQGNAEEEKKD